MRKCLVSSAFQVSRSSSQSRIVYNGIQVTGNGHFLPTVSRLSATGGLIGRLGVLVKAVHTTALLF